MKELDPDTIRIVKWIDDLKDNCRVGQVVIWIGGDQAKANIWSSVHGIEVAVLPPDSADLVNWQIDPQLDQTVVFVEQRMAIGSMIEIDPADEEAFLYRIRDLGEKATAMKHGHARMWGRSVARALGTN